MSGPETNNTAEPHSFVGAQVGHMHNSKIYVVGPDDPPEKIYDVGVRYLESGIPGKAREHIERAHARGLDHPELHFHWALAILSKRSYRDLDKRDRTMLKDLVRRTETRSHDEHGQALDVVFALLSCVDGSGGDSESAMTDLRALPSTQRDPVLRHLGLVLTGGMKQGLWNQIRDNAHKEHTARDRRDRVWSYFEPEPAPARAGHPEARSFTGWDVFAGILLAVLALSPIALLVKNALAHGDFSVLLSCLTMLILGPAAAWSLGQWYHEYRRRTALEREYGYLRSSTPPPKGGFTDQVERAFDHYFSTYAPDPAHRTAWLEGTKGVRHSLRNEVARTYRETGVKADQVRWLIRFMVRDVRRHWSGGLPLEPREIHKVTVSAKLRCVSLFLLLGAVTMTTLSAAFQQAPVTTVGCVLLATVTARFTIPLWLNIHSERRRFREQSLERKKTFQAREAEYERWTNKLAEMRPSEQEMEGWLDADKTLILDQALKHYRLAWPEVIAHAFLPTAKKPCKSAHVRRGPWRYSRYEIRIFLITEEGVREATADLEFEWGSWKARGRNNYRFDAISSVQVGIKSTRRYTLNITLTNGSPKEIPVSDAPTHDADEGKPQTETSDVNLDAAGFSHTLRILEGIAAEGKPWFERTTGLPTVSISERPEADTPSDAGATSATRNGTSRRDRSARPLPGRTAPVP